MNISDHFVLISRQLLPLSVSITANTKCALNENSSPSDLSLKLVFSVQPLTPFLNL